MNDATDYLLGEMEPDARGATSSALWPSDADAARGGRARCAPSSRAWKRSRPRRWDAASPPPLKLPGAAGTERARAGARLVLRPAVAALCAVALLAAGVGLGVVLDRDPEPATRLVLSPIEGVDPGASGRVGVTSDRVNVRVSGLPPTADGQFYELWLLGADKQLVGLGSFQVGKDGMATLKLPLPVDPGQFSYFDISLEPADGDPGHSGVSVLRGPTV